jgi:hypothetical protein
LPVVRELAKPFKSNAWPAAGQGQKNEDGVSSKSAHCGATRSCKHFFALHFSVPGLRQGRHRFLKKLVTLDCPPANEKIFAVVMVFLK